MNMLSKLVAFGPPWTLLKPGLDTAFELSTLGPHDFTLRWGLSFPVETHHHKCVIQKQNFSTVPELSLLFPIGPFSVESLSELADLSEISDGGPPEIAVAAFRDVKLMFSASNSIGPKNEDFMFFIFQQGLLVV